MPDGLAVTKGMGQDTGQDTGEDTEEDVAVGVNKTHTAAPCTAARPQI